MHIQPNDLLLFAQVSDSGNFSRAAEKIGLPKSTISRRINALEGQLGERLWQRSTRKLVLTEFGLRLLDHARQVAMEVEAAVALTEHRQAQPSGLLRISMGNDFANLVMAPILAEFIERYPTISLDLDLTARRVDLLSEGFDLAIRIGDLPDDATIVAKRIHVFTWGLYATPAYLAKWGMPEEPQELMRHGALHLCSSNRGAIPWTLSREDETWEGTPPGRVSANSPELLLRLARQGQGIVAAPDDFAQAYVATNELVKVLPSWCLPLKTAWAVFPGRHLMPAKTRVFLDLMEKRLGKQAYGNISNASMSNFPGHQ